MAKQTPDPHDTLRSWLPHVALLGTLAAGVAVVIWVISPLLEPLLFAAALALLTTPVLYSPLRGVVGRQVAWLNSEWQDRVAAVTSVVLLVIVLLLPIIALLLGTVGSPWVLADLVWGLVWREPAAFDQLGQLVETQLNTFDHLYPALHIQPPIIAAEVVEVVKQAGNFGPQVLDFFFVGTGAVVQVALGLVILAYFFVHGPHLVHGLLQFSPLDTAEQEELFIRHRHSVMRLLNDTIAVAMAKGIGIGLITWALDRSFGTGILPVVPVAVMAAFLSLLPLVGVTLAWLPVALTLLSSGHPVTAGVLAMSCMLWNWLIAWAKDHYGRRIAERDSWVGGVLFLAVIGGLLSLGIKGLLIGPMAVLLVDLLVQFWLPHYASGDTDVDADT